MSGIGLLILIALIWFSLDVKAQQMRDGTARDRYLDECRRKRQQRK